MKKALKWILGGALAMGATGGVLAFIGLKRAGDSLQTIPDVAVDAIGLTWVRFRITPTIKNPSSKGFKFHFPFISLYYGKTLLGSTNLPPANGNEETPTIDLKPNTQIVVGEPNYKPLKIRVEASRMGDLFATLGAWFATGEKPNPKDVTLRVVTVTKILVGKEQIPYTTEDNFSLV